MINRLRTLQWKIKIYDTCRLLEEKWRNEEIEADKIINFIGIKGRIAEFRRGFSLEVPERRKRHSQRDSPDIHSSRVPLFCSPRVGIPPISVRRDEKGEIKAKIKWERQIKIKSPFRTVGLGWTGSGSGSCMYVCACARDSGIVSFTYP